MIVIKMKKYKIAIITLIFLFALVNIGLAEKPTITNPSDGYVTNEELITIEWEIEDENKKSFYLSKNDEWTCFEDADDNAFLSSNDTYSWGEANIETKEEIYEYKVNTYEDYNCGISGSGWSDSITVTIDTTPPSIISKSPVGDRVDVDLDEIEMEFDAGVSGIDKEHTKNNFNANIAGNLEWTGDETLTFNLEETLEYSTEYTISVEAKDKAGNTEYFSWSFETDTPAERIDIERPRDGTEYSCRYRDEPKGKSNRWRRKSCKRRTRRCIRSNRMLYNFGRPRQ